MVLAAEPPSSVSTSVRAASVSRSAAIRAIYQSDGVREEMAWQQNQLGCIVSTSREALDEGKVTFNPQRPL